MSVPKLDVLTHGALVCNLHDHCDNGKQMAFKEVGLGPAGSPIPDVIAMLPSYTTPRVTFYEVKATRSDFQNDITSGKYEKYFDSCNRFYYAIGNDFEYRDLIGPNLPVGVIKRNKNGWRVTRGAAVLQRGLPLKAEALFSLLMRSKLGKMGSPEAPLRSRSERLNDYKEQLRNIEEITELGYCVNKKFAEKSEELGSREAELFCREERVDQKIKQAESKAIQEIRRLLGLGSSYYQNTIEQTLIDLLVNTARQAMEDKVRTLVELTDGGAMENNDD